MMFPEEKLTEWISYTKTLEGWIHECINNYPRLCIIQRWRSANRHNLLPALIFPNSFGRSWGLLEISRCRIKHSSLHHDGFPFGIKFKEFSHFYLASVTWYQILLQLTVFEVSRGFLHSFYNSTTTVSGRWELCKPFQIINNKGMLRVRMRMKCYKKWFFFSCGANSRTLTKEATLEVCTWEYDIQCVI